MSKKFPITKIALLVCAIICVIQLMKNVYHFDQNIYKRYSGLTNRNEELESEYNEDIEGSFQSSGPQDIILSNTASENGIDYVSTLQDNENNTSVRDNMQEEQVNFDKGIGGGLQDDTVNQADAESLGQKPFTEDDDVTIYQPSNSFDCPGNSDRYILRDLLSVWDEKARQHGIVYYLFYGSLLGYYRNGDVLPWDKDVDVLVDVRTYAQIRDIAVPRDFRYIRRDKIARLVIQTDVRFPNGNRTRVSCDGRIVPRGVDGCSFQDPIARVVRGNRHLDIFGIYQMNTTFFYEPVLNHSFDISELYPVQPCVFMGLHTSCPSKIPAVLGRMYGVEFNVPAKICLDGKWEDRGK